MASREVVMAELLRFHMIPLLPKIMKDLIEKPDFYDYLKSAPDGKVYLYCDAINKMVEGYQAFSEPKKYKDINPPGLFIFLLENIRKQDQVTNAQV